MNASPRDAANVVAIAGGEIVGRTKLQKIVCLLEMAGMKLGFTFDYHLHGPYSESLHIAARDASALGLISVELKRASWGGQYFVYRTAPSEVADEPYVRLAHKAAAAGSIELELLVTALFLAKNGSLDPWGDVAERKSEKATEERLRNAKLLYSDIVEVETPEPLPRV